MNAVVGETPAADAFAKRNEAALVTHFVPNTPSWRHTSADNIHLSRSTQLSLDSRTLSLAAREQPEELMPRMSSFDLQHQNVVLSGNLQAHPTPAVA